MNKHQEFEQYFRAYEQFRMAIDAAIDAGKLSNEISDEYQAIRRAGERLNEVGGMDAMRAAAYAYRDLELPSYVTTALNLIWSGIGEWVA